MSLKNGKKKWIIIIAVILVAAIGIGAVVVNATKKEEVTVSGTISYVEKRTIANSINGNGVVEAASKEDITGGTYGMKVKSVYVQEGDVVQKGDIICVFDTTDVEERIVDLQEQAIEAENERTKQNAEYDQQMIDAVNDKNEQTNTAKSNLAEAEGTLLTEKAELASLEAEYAALSDADKSSEAGVQLRQLINTQKATVDTAQSRVDTYKDRIESLEKQDTTASISDAKDAYNERVTSSVESQVDQIYELAEQVEDATIRANMSGVVTAINVTEGSNFNGGAVASIESLDAFIIEAQIEEYDIPDIKEGMKVLVKTDATRDAELEGVVTYVAPRATNSGSSSMAGFSSMLSGVDTSSFTGGGSGSATYLVKVALNEPNERLRLGMNAKVSIITEESVDTWSVAYDAVYTREDGTTYLEKIVGKDEDGNILTEELNVEIGLQGTYYVEVISSELTSDTQILIPDAQGNSSIEELLNMMGASAGI